MSDRLLDVVHFPRASWLYSIFTGSPPPSLALEPETLPLTYLVLGHFGQFFRELVSSSENEDKT